MYSNYCLHLFIIMLRVEIQMRISAILRFLVVHERCSFPPTR